MSTTVHYAFLHGGAQGGLVWDETIAALERQQPGLAARCLKLDVPGCGDKRGRDTRGLPIADVIAELDAELAALAPRDIVLVGPSQAGHLMPSLAAVRPHAFRRILHVTCPVPCPYTTLLLMMDSRAQGSEQAESRRPAGPPP